MKSIRFRFLVAALAVMLGGAIAKSQTADATCRRRASGTHALGMRGHMMGFLCQTSGCHRRSDAPR